MAADGIDDKGRAAGRPAIGRYDLASRRNVSSSVSRRDWLAAVAGVAARAHSDAPAAEVAMLATLRLARRISTCPVLLGSLGAGCIAYTHPRHGAVISELIISVLT